MIEYCLIALLISLTIVVSMSAVGLEVRTFFMNIEAGFPQDGAENIEG